MARVTINAINKALEEAGLDCQINKGDGYFYFTGSSVDLAMEQGVYGVYRLGDLSIEQWVEQAKEKSQSK